MDTNNAVVGAISVVSEAINCPVEMLGVNSRLGCCPQWDSLAQLKVILALEEKHDLDLAKFNPEELFSIEGIAKAISKQKT